MKRFVNSWQLSAIALVFVMGLLGVVVYSVDHKVSTVLLCVLIVLVLCALSILWRMKRALDRQMTPFWGALQSKVLKSLHHPHPESQPLDRLLEGLEGGTLSLAKQLELEELLRSKRDDAGETDGERERAATLLRVMPLAVQEKADASYVASEIK